MSLPLASRRSRLLVTGGSGFVGSNLVRHLLTQTDHEILNLDKLTYAGNLESLADLADHPRYHFAQADIVDLQAVRQLIADFHPDAIIHLAAESHVDRSIDGPREFIETNVVGTLNMLEASLEYWRQLKSRLPQPVRFRFLHVSTDEVYGSLGADGLFTEQTRYDPHSPYSASKASSDHLARAWHATYGLPVIVTHCSNNYGPYQFPEKLVPVVIVKCLRGEPIPVYGQGENIRDWLYVGDHCSALRTVVERGTPGETYNIGGNNELRNIDLVRMLCGILDELRPRVASHSPVAARYSQLITFVTDRPGHDFRYAIDASRIEKELGWRPRQDHLSAFEKTVRWYLDNEAWWENILNGNYKRGRRAAATSERRG